MKQFLSLITAIIIVGATTNLAQAADKYKLDPTPNASDAPELPIAVDKIIAPSDVTTL